MRLTIITTVAVLSALTFSTSASAQDAEPAPICGPDRTLVMSVGGPLCVGIVYLDGTWNDDPATCSHGYYQGSCAPAPVIPEPLPVAAYLYQMDDPTPAYVADVVAKLGKLDRIRTGLTALLR